MDWQHEMGPEREKELEISSLHNVPWCSANNRLVKFFKATSSPITLKRLTDLSSSRRKRIRIAQCNDYIKMTAFMVEAIPCRPSIWTDHYTVLFFWLKHPFLGILRPLRLKNRLLVVFEFFLHCRQTHKHTFTVTDVHTKPSFMVGQSGGVNWFPPRYSQPFSHAEGIWQECESRCVRFNVGWRRLLRGNRIK